jgi:hypothetical protein
MMKGHTKLTNNKVLSYSFKRGVLYYCCFCQIYYVFTVARLSKHLESDITVTVQWYKLVHDL